MENNKETDTNQQKQLVNNIDTVPKEKDKMAVKFPDWDLLPPALLVKRSKNDT